MELHHRRSGGGEEKVLPWKTVCMAQLPGQRAQPSSARAQGALGHLSAIGLGFGDAVYGQGLGSVIPVGPFQPGLFSISLLHGPSWSRQATSFFAPIHQGGHLVTEGCHIS